MSTDLSTDVRADATAEAVALVDGAMVEVNGHIATLRTEVETSLAAMLGETASASAQAYDSFEQQAYKINSALRRMRDTLLTAESAQA